MIKIFIPSYHRPDNIKTAKYFKKLGWNMSDIYVFIDSEADDKAEYDEACKVLGCNLVVFDMDEARKRYDYIHRPSVSRRSARQARNMFQDYAKKNCIDFYCVQDDDTQSFSKGHLVNKKRARKISLEELSLSFKMIESMMKERCIGVFGLSQNGDMIGGDIKNKVFRPKVMNTTFYLLPYIYRGERGAQDDDTSLFCGIMNEGLFTGSLAYGATLHQMPSAKQKGGLTDLYNENKLLNKALVTVIQYPSAIYAERQEKNGGRLHHHIMNRYLFPRIMKGTKDRDNISWGRWPEDYPFTNESKIDNKNQ